jgi:hypothetical protein
MWGGQWVYNMLMSFFKMLCNQSILVPLTRMMVQISHFEYPFWKRLIKMPSMSQPHFGLSVRMKLTLPKVGTWSPPGLPKTQSSIAGVKTPRIGVFFISIERSKCKCPKWPRMSHLDICSPSYGQKKGRESNWQFDSRHLKVRNQPLPDVCRWSAIGHWKALEESYNFGLDLTLIGGWSQEIWMSKILGVQPRTISGLLLGSPGKKCHSDVALTE